MFLGMGEPNTNTRRAPAEIPTLPIITRESGNTSLDVEDANGSADGVELRLLVHMGSTNAILPLTPEEREKLIFALLRYRRRAETKSRYRNAPA